MFPIVPLPKPCEVKQNPVPEETKPIPKAVETKGCRPRPPTPEAVPSPAVAPEAQKDFIPSGES